MTFMFESFVNSERCKTISACTPSKHSLRALLIQKDVKQLYDYSIWSYRLRALLIQKDVKQILAASLGIMV